ncbi:hypothetical protein CANCADRAFT_91037 [Tortispora caseinolytica NRRL Y-17796]|uniref:Uncharacterized protein n=1 Tax=Tortispora caseinolytica NRRL Y-17796 TaxID=767744 RepID=A0A1E4TLW0_9ASCO|nr:hypothetical protein CANCADRAFT_91037 [Tortispora caseinolytica NRRL Y-17796]
MIQPTRKSLLKHDNRRYPEAYRNRVIAVKSLFLDIEYWSDYEQDLLKWSRAGILGWNGDASKTAKGPEVKVAERSWEPNDINEGRLFYVDPKQQYSIALNKQPCPEAYWTVFTVFRNADDFVISLYNNTKAEDTETENMYVTFGMEPTTGQVTGSIGKYTVTKVTFKRNTDPGFKIAFKDHLLVSEGRNSVGTFYRGGSKALDHKGAVEAKRAAFQSDTDFDSIGSKKHNLVSQSVKHSSVFTRLRRKFMSSSMAYIDGVGNLWTIKQDGPLRIHNRLGAEVAIAFPIQNDALRAAEIAVPVTIKRCDKFLLIATLSLFQYL